MSDDNNNMGTDASRKCYSQTRILVQHVRAGREAKTSHLNLLFNFLSVPAAISRSTMTVLTDHETLELQRKIERLANALVTPEHCDEWKQHFRTDTDLQGIKSLLAQKRARLSYAPLPEWQQNEVTSALAQVETCIQKMEVNHNGQVASHGSNKYCLTTNSSSYVCSVVKESVVAVLNSTLDEVRRGEIFTGPSGSALQAAVVMIDKQDILDAVFQRANLESLNSEITIKKHVVAALAGLVQREMVRSVDSLSGY